MDVVVRSYRDTESIGLDDMIRFGMDIKATKMVFDEVTEPSGQLVTFYFKNGNKWTLGSSPDNGRATISAADLEPDFEKNPLVIISNFEVHYDN